MLSAAPCTHELEVAGMVMYIAIPLKQSHQDQRHACLQENLQGSLTLKLWMLLHAVDLKQQDVGGQKLLDLEDLQQLVAKDFLSPKTCTPDPCQLLQQMHASGEQTSRSIAC